MAKNRNGKNHIQPTAAVTAQEPTHNQIALLAYSLWEQGGCREGCADEDWTRAEQLLRESGERATGGVVSSGNPEAVSLASAGGLAS